ncbi:response regulator transcription factor [Streptomyces sp. NPDC052040]|uniref:helix-turn-helix transcriptional regulator n=1 Tax=unclassified Streptomyces TaxID=2593676 RepID=UPI0037CF6E7C
MTRPPMAPPVGPGSPLVRIAITSPDILAQIRQVFASKNLDVDIVRMPYVEVAVRPAAGAAGTGRPCVEAGAHHPVLPDPAPVVRPVRRLCAEYRLNVIEAADRPAAGSPAPAGPAPARPDAAPAHEGVDLPLSQRQHEVMTLVSRGVRNAEIAARLHLREKTVKNHINRIFRSLGADSRVEAVLIWQSRHDGPIPHAGRGPARTHGAGLRPVPRGTH